MYLFCKGRLINLNVDIIVSRYVYQFIFGLWFVAEIYPFLFLILYSLKTLIKDEL